MTSCSCLQELEEVHMLNDLVRRTQHRKSIDDLSYATKSPQRSRGSKEQQIGLGVVVPGEP